MHRIKYISELEAIVEKEPYVIVFISDNSCSTSRALDGKMVELTKRYSKFKLVLAELKEIPSLASLYMVLVAPTILVFLEGKELYRGDRYLRLVELEQIIQNWYENDTRKIETGKKYRHYKGNEYLVLHVAKQTETLEELVIYQALYGEKGIWARPLSMFIEKVIVNGKQVNRFEQIW